MSDVNLSIPMDLLADAVIHKLDKNSRVRKMVAEAVVQRLSKEDVVDSAAGMWLRELQANWNQAKIDSAFNQAVSHWLERKFSVFGSSSFQFTFQDAAFADYIKKRIEHYASVAVDRYAHDVAFKLTKEIRADVLTVLRSRLVTLNNEQLVELLKATEVAP